MDAISFLATAYIGAKYGGRLDAQIIDSWIARSSLPGATFQECHGFWNGQPENSWRLECILPSADTAEFKAVARAIGGALGQECILLTVAEVGSTLETC